MLHLIIHYFPSRSSSYLQHGAIDDPPAFAVENRDVPHRRHLPGIGLIGRRIGILVEFRRLFGGLVARRGRLDPAGRRATGERQRHRSQQLSGLVVGERSEEHTSELQSLMRLSYAFFCLKKKNQEKLQK